MASPALASISDLEARMGTIDDVTRAQVALEDASALIRLEAGATWLDTDGELDSVPDMILSLTCKVAARSLRNPDQATNRTIGGYSENYSLVSQEVYLTKAERRLVRKAAGTNPVGSVELETPYRKYDVDDIYMTVTGGGEEIPMGPWPEDTSYP